MSIEDVPSPYLETYNGLQELQEYSDRAMATLLKQLEACIATPAEEAMRQAEQAANRLTARAIDMTNKAKSQQAQIDWLLKRETPHSIGTWADEVFGPIEAEGGGIYSSLARATKEWDELQETTFTDTRVLAAEAADVCIVLMRLMNSLGHPDAIDEKMAINRQRKWKPDGTGHGQHMEETP